jgi:hypothetical protein
MHKVSLVKHLHSGVVSLIGEDTNQVKSLKKLLIETELDNLSLDEMTDLLRQRREFIQDLLNSDAKDYCDELGLAELETRLATLNDILGENPPQKMEYSDRLEIAYLDPSTVPVLTAIGGGAALERLVLSLGDLSPRMLSVGRAATGTIASGLAAAIPISIALLTPSSIGNGEDPAFLEEQALKVVTSIATAVLVKELTQPLPFKPEKIENKAKEALRPIMSTVANLLKQGPKLPNLGGPGGKILAAVIASIGGASLIFQHPQPQFKPLDYSKTDPDPQTTDQPQTPEFHSNTETTPQLQPQLNKDPQPDPTTQPQTLSDPNPLPTETQQKQITATANDTEDIDCMIQSVKNFGIVHEDTTLYEEIKQEDQNKCSNITPKAGAEDLPEGTIVEPYEQITSSQLPVAFYNVTVYSGRTTTDATCTGAIDCDVFLEQPRPLMNDAPLLSDTPSPEEIEADKFSYAQYTNDFQRMNGQTPYPQTYRKFSNPLYDGQPSPSDVMQGTISDCPLLAVLMSFAKYDNGSLIYKILPDQKDSPYVVNLLNLDDGSSERVEVDNYLVSDQGNKNESLYAVAEYNKQDESIIKKPLWPAIIEKALAIHLGGNFESLHWGDKSATDYMNILSPDQQDNVNQYNLENSSSRHDFIRYLQEDFTVNQYPTTLRGAGNVFQLMTDHAYSLHSFSGNTLTIKNPHGVFKDDKKETK